jgi:hypothetical protein
MAVW